ncbi:MAG TPA: GNAT family protein, partial [Candidatus Binatia bacterium]|nr:GNAT family protein [Candidatus Binatia bacterium]
PVHEGDLDVLYARHVDIESRGYFFPRKIVSEVTFRKLFHEDGFWNKEEGMLLMVNEDDGILGHIEFFRTVNYLDEIELSYIVYAAEHRGQGIASQAVDLMVRYLFETKKANRIRLIIHPENAPSRRVAEKCGFTHEGTARGAWYNRGKMHDVEVYAILRDEVIG